MQSGFSQKLTPNEITFSKICSKYSLEYGTKTFLSPSNKDKTEDFLRS